MFLAHRKCSIGVVLKNECKSDTVFKMCVFFQIRLKLGVNFLQAMNNEEKQNHSFITQKVIRTQSSAAWGTSVTPKLKFGGVCQMQISRPVPQRVQF